MAAAGSTKKDSGGSSKKGSGESSKKGSGGSAKKGSGGSTKKDKGKSTKNAGSTKTGMEETKNPFKRWFLRRLSKPEKRKKQKTKPSREQLYFTNMKPKEQQKDEPVQDMFKDMNTKGKEEQTKEGYVKFKEVRQKAIGESVKFWTSNNVDEVSTCFLLGMGVFWNYPFLQYKNGGYAFLIPFLFFGVLYGFPCVVSETYLGQFTSRGSLKCWEFSKFFQGVGFAMLVVTSIFCVYYSVILSWIVYCIGFMAMDYIDIQSSKKVMSSFL